LRTAQKNTSSKTSAVQPVAGAIATAAKTLPSVSALLAEPTGMDMESALQCRFISDLKTTGEQLEKTDFLGLLQTRVKASADMLLAQIGQTSSDCPYIVKWFAHYADADAAQLEQAIRRFAPKTGQAKDMNDYLEAVVARVSNALQKHIATGTMADVPPEIVEEKHAPEDFVHIAEQNAVAQLGSLCSNDGSNKNKNKNKETNYQDLYESADAKPIAPLVKIWIDPVSKERRILKHSNAVAMECFQLFSGKAHFPVYYGGQGNYCMIQCIGDGSVRTIDSQLGAELLDQLAEICTTVSKGGMYVSDLYQNLINIGGTLYAIDLKSAKKESVPEAMEHNSRDLKQLLKSDLHDAFDAKLRELSR
jgi:hypothetical protein